MTDRYDQYVGSVGEKEGERREIYQPHWQKSLTARHCLYDTGVWRNTDCRECRSYMGHHGSSGNTFSDTGSESQS